MPEAGYQGGKTALYALVASLRQKPAKPLVRFEGLPGVFSQHDFEQVGIEFLNGTSQQIHFFASRLVRVLKVARCSNCGGWIVWARTAAGKKIPLNPWAFGSSVTKSHFKICRRRHRPWGQPAD